MEERRKAERVNINWNVYSNDKYMPGKIGKIVNISKHGAKLVIEKGTVDSIHIHHGEFLFNLIDKQIDEKLEIKAKPIWIRITEDDNYHIGLRFFEISETIASNLDNVINKFRNNDESLEIKAILIIE